MRAHLMITELCSPDKLYIVLFHLLLIVYQASAFKSWGDYSWETTFTIHSESTQNILGNDWRVKIRPKKILQSTFLQRHLIKHSLARNPEWQNDFFLKICIVVQILKDKYTLRGCWLLCVKVTLCMWKQHLYTSRFRPVVVKTSLAFILSG